MNKYSSKAIKTAATVGMSLAMVLSAMPAVGNATSVEAATTVCTSKTTYKAGADFGTTTKTVAGAKDVDAVKTEVKGQLTELNKKTTYPVALTEVPVYLGFKTDNGSTVYKIADLSNVDSASTNIVYGYYAAAETIINGLPTIKVNDLVSKETTITFADGVRTDGAVRQGITSAANALTDNKGWKKTVDITDENGKPATGQVKIAYVIDGKTYHGEDFGNLQGVSYANDIIVKLEVAEDFTDYSDCAQVGTGLGITDRYTAKNAYNEIVSAFDKAKVSFEDIKPGDKVDFAGKTITESLGNKIILTETAIPQLDIDFKTVLKELARYLDNTTDEGKAVERLLDLDTAMTDMFKVGGHLDKAKRYDEDTKFTTTKQYTDAVDLLEKFNDFDTYLTNLNDAENEAVTDAKSVLEDLVNNYVIENDGDLLDAYLTKLDKYYEAFVDSKGDKGITKSDVDTAIKNIKNGATVQDIKNKDIVLEKSEYTTFKEDAGVEEYMTKFEDMYDEIQAVKDAVATSNEAYKALIKDGSDSVRSFLKGKEFKDIKSKITLEDYKILKAYKEEVLDAVLTLETKEVGNSFVNKSKKSIFATEAQLNKVLGNISNGTTLDTGLFTKLDKENGEFNWDKLVKHMEKVEASLEAITTNIEKLDAVSLTVNDRAAILAADDAVYFLTDDGAGNLTKAETRTVKNADRKVTELMEAYRIKFGSLNVELNSWVNKGNGDWAYYENGNAVTKWVASGSDWYYVRGGVMLRNSWIASDSQGTKWYYVDDAGKMVSNTTVNGYTFNSYGVWVK